MLFQAQNADAELSGYWWWYIPPGLAVAFLGTVAGAAQLRHRRVHQPAAARGRGGPAPGQKSGGKGLPRRFQLGITPVVRARTAPGTARQPRERRPGSRRTGAPNRTQEQTS